jgi:phosphoenolpyruvate-protein phosphotransferase
MMCDMNQMQKNFQSRTFQGVSGAPGMVSGPAYLWQKRKSSIPRLNEQDPEVETIRIQDAVQMARSQIQELSKQLEAGKHPEEAAIFVAHAMLVEDKTLHRRVRQFLSCGLNAEAAWMDAVEAFASQLEGLDNQTLRLRAADLRDIGQRVLRILLNESTASITIDHPSVIIAQDLTPSETVTMNKNVVLAFCTADGGPTSHTAILAKALGIPAVVGLGMDILDIEAGNTVLVNGNIGQVIVSPDDETITAFTQKTEQASAKFQTEFAQAMSPAITIDGKQFEIVANIGSVEDAKNALYFGAEGVGLFRTEFLFLNRTSIPDEDEQYRSYRAVLDVMGKRPVVVRTLDAGGDKELTCLAQGQEANPFLGCRAIRLCLSQPELFKQQLRALLQAGEGHDLRIMFPMVATLSEIRQAKALLAEARQELLSRGLPTVEGWQVGIMVEIPSAAILASQFASEVDFFSIGTNDLTQYTLAADRTNPKVAHLNDHCHPAVIHLIEQTVCAAHKVGIWVGVCGEMAGDEEAIPILVGLGIDELSMSPALIPRAKSLIRRLSVKQTEALVRSVLYCDSAEAVRHIVRQSLS